MARFTNRRKAINDNELYENILEERGVKEIVQFTTPELVYPTEGEKNRLNIVKHVWRQGDKFWRLATKFYGDPNLWYIIAQFNKAPTEGHLMPGDIIEIPTNLNVILGALE